MTKAQNPDSHHRIIGCSGFATVFESAHAATDRVSDGRLDGVAVGLISLGCAKNLVDSEVMLGTLVEAGATVVSNPEAADVIIVNTCGFLTDAKQESIDTIFEMSQYKSPPSTKTRCCRSLVVAGCLATRYGRQLAELMPEVDAFLGVAQTSKIVDAVVQSLSGHLWHQTDGASYLYDYERPRLLSTEPGSAYLKIGEGCNNACSFCAIPLIRGSFRSRPIASIEAETRGLIEAGSREIVVIAQDTTRYGEDIYGSPSLHVLLDRLCAIPDLEWLRVLYMHPDRITDELLSVISRHSSICRYLDIPLQHANGSILRSMNRRGCGETYSTLVANIRERLPNVVIRTSFIVGYPGETDAQFKDIETLMSEVRFERVGIFAYSQEEGTPAGQLENQVPQELREYRLNRLMSLQRNISREFNESRIGATVDVLLEGSCPDGPGQSSLPNRWFGRSSAEAPDVDGKVIVSISNGCSVHTGDIVTAKITEASDYDVTAVVIPSGRNKLTLDRIDK